MGRRVVAFCSLLIGCCLLSSPTLAATWEHYSCTNYSADGKIPPPTGTQKQTSGLSFDVDKDGRSDLIVCSRNTGKIEWWRRGETNWTRYLIDNSGLTPEAGGHYADIDGDGDLDLMLGQDASGGNVWWWENPYPNYDPATAWSRYSIKTAPGRQQHDEMFGDFDGDGEPELAFWVQNYINGTDDPSVRGLYVAEIPSPATTEPWSFTQVYAWPWPDNTAYPKMLEGMDVYDMNGDGKVDIVGGGRYFCHTGGTGYVVYNIDTNYSYGRIMAGDFIPGGAPEVLMSSGDTKSGQSMPTVALRLYAYDGTNWNYSTLVNTIERGHTLDKGDFNNDGLLDFVSGEMRLSGEAATLGVATFLNAGDGTFSTNILSATAASHMGRAADLDGDGDLDVFSKSYQDTATYGTNVEVWLQNGTQPLQLTNWVAQWIDTQADSPIWCAAEDLDGDTFKDLVAGDRWYKNPGTLTGAWTTNIIGSPFSNVAVVADFDHDGDMDLFGTTRAGASDCNGSLAWAENDGSGSFTVRSNIQTAQGDFVQGVSARIFNVGKGLKIMLSWHETPDVGLQMISVPTNPATETWTYQKVSTTSQQEDLGAADIDKDGRIDLFLGTKWARNVDDTGANWQLYTIGMVSNLGYQAGTPSVTYPEPDRVQLADFNLDGRLDAVVGLEGGTNIVLFTSPADPTNEWTRSIIGTSEGQGFSMGSGDIDGDGDVDIVVGEHRGDIVGSNNRVLLFVNDRTPSNWTRIVVNSMANSQMDHHDGTQVADLDNDGDLDIYSIGFTRKKVYVYENKSRDPEPPANLVATPEFLLAAGSYALFADVTIECATPGATIYYTTDGSTPTNTSSVYGAPIHLTADTTVKAYATKADMDDSNVTSADYDITLAGTNLLLNPSFEDVRTTGFPEIWSDRSTSGGTSDTVVVQDGLRSLKVTNYPSYVYSPQTVGVQNGEVYQLSGWLKCDGTASEYVRVRAATGVVGAPFKQIQVNGEQDWIFQSTIVTANATSVRVDCLWELDESAASMGWFDGLYFGPEAGFNQAEMPVFSPTGGVFSSSINVTMTCVTAGATIRYTTDGSVPVSTSTVYSAPVALTTGVTLRARAFAAGYADSAVRSATYTIDTEGTVQPPAFTPNGGAFANFTSVAIASSTEGATNYYTLDGSEPSLASASCTNGYAVALTTSCTVKAFAIKAGSTPSTTNSAVFTFTAAEPTMSPAPGAYASAVTVTLSSVTSGAQIRYTTNGSEPDGASTLYSTPFTLTTSTVVKARAFAAGMTPSSAASDAYDIYNDGVGAVIDVWYGTNQAFGANGNPQEWVNILGRVDNTATGLTYSLNGGAEQDLNMGPCTYGRLSSNGDFNVEMAYGDLEDGANTVQIKAWNSQGQLSVKNVQVNYTTGQVWALPYSIDWGVSTNVPDVALATDGKWIATNGRVRPVDQGYDRTLAVGDITWTNYEIVTEIAIVSNGWELLSPSSMANVGAGSWAGLVANWQGNFALASPEYECQSQPRNGWNKAGALLSFYTANRYDFGLVLWDGQDYMGVNNIRSAITNYHPTVSNYYMKLRTEMTNSGTQCFYRGKVWPVGSPEPEAWDIEHIGSAAGKTWTRGCATLCSYECNVSFGNVQAISTEASAGPAITPAGGTFWGSATATLAAAVSGATNYYTTNGTDPTSSDNPYTSEQEVVLGAGVWTVKTLSVRSGLTSAVNSAVFAVNGQAATPVITPDTGLYADSVEVSISCATPGVTIRYTTNNTTPSTGSPAYAAPFTLYADAVVKAVAMRGDLTDSGTASSSYIISGGGGGVAASNCFSWWRFDETSGTEASDASGNDRDGAVSGASWTTGGKIEGALDFEKDSNQHVNMGGLDVGGSALTLMAWVKPESVYGDGNGNQYARILAKSHAWSLAGAYWVLGCSSRGMEFGLKTGADTNAAATVLASTATLLTNNLWGHLAATYDGSTMRIYHNGVEIKSGAKTGTITASPGALVYVGSDPNNSAGAFDGIIDEVKVFTQTLSQAEIQMQMTNTGASTEWLLLATAGENGSVTPSGAVYVPEGNGTSFVVAADAYYHIASILTNGGAVAAAVDQPAYTVVWANVVATGILQATFAENVATNESTPEWWIAQYYDTNDYSAAEETDSDGDGMFAWQEYVAGTVPTNADSILDLARDEVVTGSVTGKVVQWTPRAGRVYDVLYATNLLNAFGPVSASSTNLPATQPAYTDTLHNALNPLYYRVRVRLP